MPGAGSTRQDSSRDPSPQPRRNVNRVRRPSPSPAARSLGPRVDRASSPLALPGVEITVHELPTAPQTGAHTPVPSAVLSYLSQYLGWLRCSHALRTSLMQMQDMSMMLQHPVSKRHMRLKSMWKQNRIRASQLLLRWLLLRRLLHSLQVLKMWQLYNRLHRILSHLSKRKLWQKLERRKQPLQRTHRQKLVNSSCILKRMLQ